MRKKNLDAIKQNQPASKPKKKAQKPFFCKPLGDFPFFERGRASISIADGREGSEGVQVGCGPSRVQWDAG